MSRPDKQDVKRKRVRYSTAWARRPTARAAREVILSYVLGPIIQVYTHPRVDGLERLDGLQPPVVFTANHSSHLDTAVILKSLPLSWRRRVAVVAAADYFYQNWLVARLVTLSFGTVPLERKSGLARLSFDRLDRLIKDRWSILLYPEGTRSRNGKLGKFKPGTAVLALKHKLPIVPIALVGTHDAMPPGRGWPRRHPVSLTVGSPLQPEPDDDPKEVTERLQEVVRDMLAERR